jgi:hypothetical protein
MLAANDLPSIAPRHQIWRMRRIEDIRHENLLACMARYPTIQAFADAVGRSHSQISQLKNRNKHSGSTKVRNLESALAREMERKLGLAPNWLDEDHSARWPFPHVDRARWDRLTEDGKAYVQSVMNLAISQRENATIPQQGGGGAVNTDHAAGPQAPLLHEPRQRPYGT